jgi:hypothetical protein
VCAIVDNNVRHEVFGGQDTQTPAGKYFLDWLDSSRGALVIGGGLRRELGDYRRFEVWFETAVQFGRARQVDDARVESETNHLLSQSIRSDDEHVLALARVSGARLLFTNDRDLQRDFQNPEIVGGTRGRIYTTVERTGVRRSHRDLLKRTDLCHG